MERYRDPLADMTDEDLRRVQEETPRGSLLASGFEENKYDVFKWGQYDWSAFDPAVYGYDVIRLGANENSRRRTSPLSGVYFTIVLPHWKAVLTVNGTKSWYPLTCSYKNDISQIAAYRSEGPRKKQKPVLLHRRVLSLASQKLHETVDHINGYSLDNRDFNLRPASYCLNMLNRAAWKESASGLMRWVEYRNSAKTQVGGVFMVDGTKHRSPQTWPVDQQQMAHDWVLEERQKLYGSIPWVDGSPPLLPTFPPLIKSSINLIGVDLSATF